MSDTEDRILEIERAYFPDLSARIAALEQSLSMFWMTFGFGSPPPATCSATITGTVIGCLGNGLISQTVTIKDAGGGTLGTTTTGSGGAAGQFSVVVTVTAGDVITVNIAVTGFDAIVDTFTVACGTNARGTITPTVATGYVCTAACDSPLPTSIPVTDSIYGSGTATYVSTIAGTSTWTWSTTVNYPGPGVALGGCGAVAVCPVVYKLTANSGGGLVPGGTYTSVSNVNACPAAAGGFVRNFGVGSIAAQVCPPSLSVTLSTISGNHLWQGTAATIHFG